MSKTALVRRSRRLVEMNSKKKVDGEATLSNESVENVLNLKRTEEEFAKKRKRAKIEFEKKDSGESMRKRTKMELEERESGESKMKRGDKDIDVAKNAALSAMKVKVNTSCEWNFPVLALKKVFSFLDWNGLGRAMLVCQKWNEVGGHPSLWTRFPLQLSCGKLKNFPKIYRLNWVHSLTISLSILDMVSLVTLIQAAIKFLPRLEELFIFYDHFLFFYFNDPKVSILNILKADDNKLVRVGTRLSNFNSSEPEDYLYYVSNCDAGTHAFLKKTHLEKDKNKKVSIYGLPGLHLTNEILETICTISRKPVDLATNLTIDLKLDLRKLASSVDFLEWDMVAEEWEEQEVAPLNAILNLQDGKDNGVFEGLAVPKNLLLKSSWVERLGGKSTLEASIGSGNVIYTAHTRTGLVIVDPKVI